MHHPIRHTWLAPKTWWTDVKVVLINLPASLVLLLLLGWCLPPSSWMTTTWLSECLLLWSSPWSSSKSMNALLHNDWLSSTPQQDRKRWCSASGIATVQHKEEKTVAVCRAARLTVTQIVAPSRGQRRKADCASKFPTFGDIWDEVDNWRWIGRFSSSVLYRWSNHCHELMKGMGATMFTCQRWLVN